MVSVAAPSSTSSASYKSPPRSPGVRLFVRVITYTDRIGLDKKPYTTYEVAVKRYRTNWTLQKRYRDFEALRNALCSKHPAIKDFNFPHKSKLNTFAEFTKERRRKGFEEFLMLCVSIFGSDPPAVLDIFLQLSANTGKQTIAPALETAHLTATAATDKSVNALSSSSGHHSQKRGSLSRQRSISASGLGSYDLTGTDISTDAMNNSSSGNSGVRTARQGSFDSATMTMGAARRQSLPFPPLQIHSSSAVQQHTNDNDDKVQTNAAGGANHATKADADPQHTATAAAGKHAQQTTTTTAAAHVTMAINTEHCSISVCASSSDTHVLCDVWSISTCIFLHSN